MAIRNILLVDIDSERDETVIISHPDNLTIQGTDNPIVDDMACLCEAIVTLIHVAEQQGAKSSPSSLRDCIKHLQDGFADASYKTK